MHKVLIVAVASLFAVGCSYPQRWKPRGIDTTKLSQAEKDQWNQKYFQDAADCTKEGYAYQTYSGYSGWSVNQYGGGGGSAGGSHFNRDVGDSCMSARGWEPNGHGMYVLGSKVF